MRKQWGLMTCGSRTEPRLKENSGISLSLILAPISTLVSIHSLFSVHVGKDGHPTVPRFLSLSSLLKWPSGMKDKVVGSESDRGESKS